MITKGRLAICFTIIMAMLMALAQPAGAWTWSGATHPAGSVNIGGSTSGGGVFLWHGTYFIPGAGHVDQPLGVNMWETPNTSAGDPTGSGFIGHVAYSTAPDNNGNDVGLIATGTDPISTNKVVVSQGWTNAAIDSYQTSTIPSGTWVCETGYSWPTEAAGGYRCGQTTRDCVLDVDTACQAYNSNGIVSAGDSGGLVWWYGPSGYIHIFGWQTNGVYPLTADGQSYTGMLFRPTWVVAHENWTAAESWSSWGYPSGQDNTGCFVTSYGTCQSVP